MNESPQIAGYLCRKGSHEWFAPLVSCYDDGVARQALCFFDGANRTVLNLRSERNHLRDELAKAQAREQVLKDELVKTLATLNHVQNNFIDLEAKLQDFTSAASPPADKFVLFDRANRLATTARKAGYVLTIEERSLEPLAMGNTTPFVTVRPARTPA